MKFLGWDMAVSLPALILIFVGVVLGSAHSQEIKCNRTLENGEEVTTPRTRNAAWGKAFDCMYQLRSTSYQSKDVVFIVRFRRFKWGTLLNATHCSFGHLQIIDGNFTGSDPGYFCGEIERSHTFISETNSVTLRFRSENFTDQTYFSFDVREEVQQRLHPRYGQHSALYPNRRGQPLPNGSPCDRVFTECRLQTCFVQSPSFPGFYPRNLKCRYLISTRQPFIKMFTENEEFNVDGQRCENLISCPIRPISPGPCPFDRIRVYDGHLNDSQLIGEFCGAGRFPFSIVGTGSELLVEFTTSKAGPMISTGFHFNVDSWPGHPAFSGPQSGGGCSYVFTVDALESSGDSEGLFLSPGHWYPPGTVCTYQILGKKDQIVRLYFPSFRVGRITAPVKEMEGDCLESLTIFDGPDANPETIIKTFCDTFSRPMEKHDFVSTGNSLFVQFISQTGSYSGSSLYYWAYYDFFNNSHSGEVISETECDEKFSSLKPYGSLSSPMNSLIYKKALGKGVNCSYFFTAEERYYGRVELTIDTINFKTQNCEDKVSVADPAVKGKTGMNIENMTGSYSSIDVCKRGQLPVKVTSRGQYFFANLQVDGATSLNYFKSSLPLFTGSYRFIHPAICGSTEFPVGAEGTLIFPNLYDESIYSGQPETAPITCLWELHSSDVTMDVESSISLSVELIKFSSTNCDEDRLDISIPGRLGPILTLCGQSMIKSRKVRDTQQLDSTDMTEPTEGVNLGEEKNADGEHLVRQSSSEELGETTSPLPIDRSKGQIVSNEKDGKELVILLEDGGDPIIPQAQKGGGGVIVKSSNVAKPKSGKDRDSNRDPKGGGRVSDSPDDWYVSREASTEQTSSTTALPTVRRTTTTVQTTTGTPRAVTTQASRKTTRKVYIPNEADYRHFKSSIETVVVKESDLKEGRILIHLQVRDPSESFVQISWTRLYPMNPDDLPSYSPLESSDFEFQCPNTSVFIPHRLLCNGIRNCPRVNGTEDDHDESEAVCNFFKKIPLHKMILGSLGISACAFVGFVATAFYYRRKDKERAVRKGT